MTYEAPSAPQSIGGVLDDWLRLFSASFSRCWPLALIAVAAGSLLVFVVNPTLPALNASLWQHRLQLWSLLTGPQNALATLLLALIQLTITGALFSSQIGVMRGQSISTNEALRTGARRLPRLVLGFILQGLIMLAIMIPAIVLGIVAAVLAKRHSLALSHDGLMILLGVVLVLAVITAVIYVGVRLMLWQAAVFAEDAGAASSLGRSWRLVKGDWWRVTVILFVANVVIAVLGFVIPWALSAALGLFAIQAAQLSDFSAHLRIAQIISQSTHLLTLPLTTAIVLVIFRDLTLRREGGDLAARTEALGAR